MAATWYAFAKHLSSNLLEFLSAIGGGGGGREKIKEKDCKRSTEEFQAIKAFSTKPEI